MSVKELSIIALLADLIPFFNLYYSDRAIGISASDDKWHHICVSWQSSSGEWQSYLDGGLASSGTGFKTGYTIQAGGSLVLGQEQDSVGGGFDSTQSLKGSLADVNVWSCVLEADKILEISKSCLRATGDVYKWADFKDAVVGNTEVVTPSSCEGNE